MSVSEVTRRCILDGIEMERLHFSGNLNDPEFLHRLYDLDAMPSYDPRCETAFGDIYQHTVNNDDYERNWIFRDDRFNLIHCDDEWFLAFLCEMLHPLVRGSDEDVDKLLRLFNEQLERDGWELVEKMHLSGRPIFAARRVNVGAVVSLEGAKCWAGKFNAEYIVRQVARMEKAIQDDPELAIGTAKELVESVCKTILLDRGGLVSKRATLPELTKMTMKELKMVPDSIPDSAKGSETIKRLLMNLSSVGQGMAELRGLYGSGHGKHANTRGLEPRHAQLAVGAATTLAVFLFDTYMAQEAK